MPEYGTISGDQLARTPVRLRLRNSTLLAKFDNRGERGGSIFFAFGRRCPPVYRVRAAETAVRRNTRAVGILAKADGESAGIRGIRGSCAATPGNGVQRGVSPAARPGT